MSYYNDKDKVKFNKCNKLITQGAYGSSSYKYSLGYDDKIINDTKYTRDDLVGVSVNGKRKNRISFNRKLVLLAINSNSRIVKDNSYHTSRDFNVGERELNSFLIDNGCKCIYESDKGQVWRKING